MLLSIACIQLVGMCAGWMCSKIKFPSLFGIYVIVLFATFTGLAQGEGVSALRFINIPVSICLGMGIAQANSLHRFFTEKN